MHKLLEGLVLAWDFGLATLNLILPKYKKGALVAAQHGGKWPEFHPPTEGDSRCGCPALNAMANHGILPRDGKNITFSELGQKVHETYNFAPSFCYFVPKFCAGFLNRDYNKDTLDLADLNLRSDEAIEHDSSLVREDEHVEPDLGKISPALCNRLLSSATGQDADGKPMLTVEDVGAALALRRYEARKANANFQLAKPHEFFGAANASTLIRIYGGNIEELKIHLLEERLPDNWESYVRERNGLTMVSFNKTAKAVTAAIDEKKVAEEQADTKTSVDN